MDQPSLVQFVEEFCTSDNSIENFPLEIRTKAINKVVEIITKDPSSTKKAFTFDKEVKTRLKAIQHHLTWIDKIYSLEELDLTMKRQFDKTQSQTDQLTHLLLGLIAFGYSPSLIEDLLVESEILLHNKTVNKKLSEMYETVILDLLAILISVKSEEQIKKEFSLTDWKPETRESTLTSLKKIVTVILEEENSG